MQFRNNAILKQRPCTYINVLTFNMVVTTAAFQAMTRTAYKYGALYKNVCGHGLKRKFGETRFYDTELQGIMGCN